jgi:integrase/recombinase XerD
MSEATADETDATGARIGAVYDEMRTDNSTSDSTTDRYIRGADRFLNWLAENEIDPFNAVPRDFRDFMNAMVAEGYAYGTLQPFMYGTRAFYRGAEDLHTEQQQLLEAGRDTRVSEIPEVSDPTDSFSLGDFTNDGRSKQSKELEANDDHHKLTKEKIDQLCEHVPTPRTRNVLIIRLMYQCCLRRGELVRLKVGEDVNRDERTIDVPAVKGNKGRDTPIPYQATLDDLMSIWIDVERKGVASAASSDYLFPTERSEHISEDYVSQLVREAAERAPDVDQETLYVDNMGREKKKIHSHTLRASGAHRIWDKKEDIYLVSKVLGHSDVDTTERYLDVDKDDIVGKVREAW